MDSGPCTTIILLLLSFVSITVSESVIQISQPNHHHHSSDKRIRSNRREEILYCDSWKYAVETNDAGVWGQIPPRCMGFVKEYMTGDRYMSDLQAVADHSAAFARTVKVNGDGKDAWVFDIDETLLSNLPYYAVHGFGSEIFDEKAFNAWVGLAEAPALSASLRLYRELEQMGFKLFLLTGRAEYLRTATEKNLKFSGYNHWDKLILRGPSDEGKKATFYKSEKRKELEEEGYKIHGSSGDQWSDLLGFALAQRSFKLPNPMYYIG
ncbi:hypothetical protein LguiA_020066 [Lonicera macranthoides]